MSNELAKTNRNLPTTHADVDPYETVASEEGGGTWLKFAKGEWIANEAVLNGAKMVAEMDRLSKGWRKWVNSKPVDADIGFVHKYFQPKTRGELDDLEGSNWPLNSRGERTDPWQFGYYLQFHDEAGEVFTWTATSFGAKKAIGRLTTEYLRQGKRALPVVVLNASQYRHPVYGKTDIPVLPVVGWTTPDAPTAPAEPPAALRVAGPAPVVTSGPMKGDDDPVDVPFDFDDLPEIRG